MNTRLENFFEWEKEHFWLASTSHGIIHLRKSRRPQSKAWIEEQHFLALQKSKELWDSSKELFSEFSDFGAVEFDSNIRPLSADKDTCYFPSNGGIGLGDSFRHNARANPSLFNRIRNIEVYTRRLNQKSSLYLDLFYRLIEKELPNPHEFKFGNGLIIVNGRGYLFKPHIHKDGSAEWVFEKVALAINIED